MIENILRQTREHRVSVHLANRSYGVSISESREDCRALAVSPQDERLALSHTISMSRSTERWKTRNV